jgi:peptidoglycan/xylan/chitin deacetylase (PgdA/CDA1 family)
LTVAKGVGLFAVMRLVLRRRLLVLCYHSVISDDAPNDPQTIIAVTTRQLEAQLQILQRRWKPITLAELDAAVQGTAVLPDHAVLVTFDDGFRNNLTLVAPLLHKYGISATVFLTSGLIGTDAMLWTQEVVERQRHLRSDALRPRSTAELKRLPNAERLAWLDELRAHSELVVDSDWQRELYALMNWDEVRQLRSFGVDVGAHTVSHPILSSLAPDAVRQELSVCKAAIEHETGLPCFALAYPNGGEADFTEAIMDECLALGFRLGFNLFGRRNPPLAEMNSLSIHRVCVTRDVSLIEFERMLCLSR